MSGYPKIVLPGVGAALSPIVAPGFETPLSDDVDNREDWEIAADDRTAVDEAFREAGSLFQETPQEERFDFAAAFHAVQKGVSRFADGTVVEVLFDGQSGSTEKAIKPRVRVSSARIKAAMLENGRNRRKAAAALGITEGSLSKLIRKRPELSEFRRGTAATTEALSAALLAYDGDRDVVAQIYGLARRTLDRYIAEKPELQHLRVRVLGEKGGRKGITVQQVEAALEKHGGIKARAARELGVTPHAIDLRIESSRQLDRFRMENMPPRFVSNYAVLDSLRKHNGNRAAVRKELGLAKGTLDKRIRTHAMFARFRKGYVGVDDILAKTKRNLNEYSNDDLLEMFNAEGRNTAALAKKLDVYIVDVLIRLLKIRPLPF